MIFAKEGSVHVDGSIPIGMNLIPASSAAEELAPTRFEPLIAAKGEPLTLCTTAATILTRSMRIDFHGHRTLGERFLSGQPIDLSSQLVCLFAIESPGLDPSSCLDLAQSLKKQYAAGVPGADVGNDAGRFVSNILVHASDVLPELDIALFSSDRLA